MSNERKNKSAASVAAFDRVTGKVRKFFADTIAELGRCTWPGRGELFESTVLVVVVIGILAVFVAGVDEAARIAIRVITTGKF